MAGRWLTALLPRRESAGRERSGAPALREGGDTFRSQPPSSGRWGWRASFRSMEDNQASVHDAFAGFDYQMRAGPPKISVLSGNAGAAAMEGEGSSKALSAASAAGPEPSLGGRGGSESRRGHDRASAQRAASLHVQSALAVRGAPKCRLKRAALRSPAPALRLQAGLDPGLCRSETARSTTACSASATRRGAACRCRAARAGRVLPRRRARLHLQTRASARRCRAPGLPARAACAPGACCSCSWRCGAPPRRRIASPSAVRPTSSRCAAAWRPARSPSTFSSAWTACCAPACCSPCTACGGRARTRTLRKPGSARGRCVSTCASVRRCFALASAKAQGAGPVLCAGPLRCFVADLWHNPPGACLPRRRAASGPHVRGRRR